MSTTFFTATASELKRALGMTKAAMAGRRALPILGDVLIGVAADGVTLTATKYDATATATVMTSRHRVGDHTAVLVSHAWLARTVSAVGAVTRDELTIEIGSDEERPLPVVVVSGGGYSVPVVARHKVEDYPSHGFEPTAAPFILNAAVFEDALSRTMVASSQDETLPLLTGVRLTGDGEKITFEATDRYRIISQALDYSGPTFDLIVSAPAWRKLSRFVRHGKVELTVGKGVTDRPVLKLDVDGGSVLLEGIDGTYPKLAALYPEPEKLVGRLTVKREELLAQARLALKVGELNAPTSLSFLPTGVVCRAMSYDGADYGAPAIGGHWLSGSLSWRKLGVNARYLVDALTVLEGEHVTISAQESLVKPVVFTNGEQDVTTGGVRYLLMPVRIPADDDRSRS